ncbi:MAG: hypothetical protein Unbinned5179contig1000_35 [Prokaryotic dsDNA virus sp.]|nr:MAG: hypothetical protein Unbinned5179contig1000_35 [Prokaryotic dsDNA virus sp.]|tara:strand:- start:3010 stop:3405 length:396 start_codon:yes stop_codon:yes gene_type:complete
MATLLSNEDKYYWYIDGERIAIVEKKDSTAVNVDPDWQSPTTGGENLRLIYTSKAAEFSIDSMTTSSEIPSQFHEALALKVISDLYTLPGEKFNLQLAQYFAQQYSLHIREAKKYAKRNHIRGGRINPHSF